jgi:hypothetical protein
MVASRHDIFSKHAAMRLFERNDFAAEQRS